MDACIDGAYVKDLNFRSIRDEICELAEKARYCEIVREITYSRVSESTGLVFQCKIRDVFQDPHAEDLWLDCYCAVTNITRNGMCQIKNRDWRINWSPRQ